MKHHLTALFVAGSLLSFASAQLPGPGLSWTGTLGGDVRTFLPDCSNLPVAAVRGEAVELRVWGDPQSPFALFAALSDSQCLPFPGIGNGLILDAPIFVVAMGSLTQTSPCLSCPPGYEPLRVVLPQVVPPGTTLAVQAIGYGATRVSFTAAITATIR